MPSQVKYGGKIPLNLRLAPAAARFTNVPRTSSNSLVTRMGFGRPTNGNPFYTVVSGNPGSAALTGLNMIYMSPFEDTVIVSGVNNNAMVPTVSDGTGKLWMENYGPNYVGFCVSNNDFGNMNLSLLSFDYLGAGDTLTRFRSIDNIPTGLTYNVGWNAKQGLSLNCISAFGGQVDANTIGFSMNQTIGNTLDGLPLSIAYTPGFTPVIGNSLSLIQRDNTDVLLGGSNSAVGMPAMTTTVQGRSGRNFSMLQPTTIGAGVGWNRWTDSTLLERNSGGGVLANYRTFKQTVRDSGTLTFENATASITLVTMLTPSITGGLYSCDIAATPWGFIVSPGWTGVSDTSSGAVLITPDAQYWYDIDFVYQGQPASTFVNAGVIPSLQNLSVRIENNGAIYFYNPNVPTRVLVAFDLSFFFNANVALPTIPPYSLPCMTDCLNDGSVIARLNI